jgi:hypothetical protein
MARFKAPRAIAFCDAIGRHPTGKPDYQWARTMAESATPVAGRRAAATGACTPEEEAP